MTSKDKNLSGFDHDAAWADSGTAMFGHELEAQAQSTEVRLKDWSAQDFANVYVRFRPHLMSQATRLLRDTSQAEEVVQDSFLYLMTALPDIDSELGVLRFLKWKTKMLCLDALRASRGRLSGSLLPLPDDIPSEVELTDSIEKAEDAAIVRLALARLSPRHREVLIATIYEEKTHEEVASQLGIGGNAFRQLLFRARAAFRQSLVGEAEIAGKSLSEIVALAAKKAAKSRATAATSLVLVFGIAISNLGASPTVNDETYSATALTEVRDVVPVPFKKRFGDSAAQTDQAAADEEFPKSRDSLSNPLNQIEQAIQAETSVPETPTHSSQEVDAKLMSGTNSLTNSLGDSFVSSFAAQELEVFSGPERVEVSSQMGLKAFFGLDLNSETIIQYMTVEYESSGLVLKGVPTRSLAVIEEQGDIVLVSYAATDFLVGDFSGLHEFASTVESQFSRSAILLELSFGPGSEVKSANVRFVPTNSFFSSADS